MTLPEIIAACHKAALAGTRVTFSTHGPRPKGFPRGELLSVGTDGSRNYSYDPVRVLACLYREAARVAKDAKP